MINTSLTITQIRFSYFSKTGTQSLSWCDRSLQTGYLSASVDLLALHPTIHFEPVISGSKFHNSSSLGRLTARTLFGKRVEVINETLLPLRQSGAVQIGNWPKSFRLSRFRRECAARPKDFHQCCRWQNEPIHRAWRHERRQYANYGDLRG